MAWPQGGGGTRGGLVRVSGDHLAEADGTRYIPHGVCVGGWLMMENFITGYSANEALMRSSVRRVLGDDRAARFFDRLLTAFFGDADAAFLASVGIDSVRLPVSYRHFEDDLHPRVLREDGFAHLDRAIAACAAHGIRAVVDLHALPGSQNQHWHSDNATHRALFWEHRDFQDRVVWLWEQLAGHYAGDPRVLGYNLMNEPADESGEVVGPFYERLVAAVRAVDPDHVLFVDGNTFATDFSAFGEPWPNTVYTLHDYVPAGLGRGGDYPGLTDDVWWDLDRVTRKFLDRSSYARETGTPLYVGEFGSIYTGDPARDAHRLRVLDDQLALYGEHGAGWAIWTYKDLGRQGLVGVAPDSAYRTRFGDFVAKKDRLAADQWGSDWTGPAEVTVPVQELVAREFPGFDPYPWGRRDWVRTLLNNLLFAQPLVDEYADLFRGLDDSELDALADSFAFESCLVREPLRARLAAACAAPAAAAAELAAAQAAAALLAASGPPT